MTTLIQPPPPGYRKWWWVPAVFLVAALVVAATLWLTDLLRPGDGCDAGLDRNESGQCVGVTDGSEQFTDDIADLTGRIRDENETVVDSGDPYVSIVLLTPMTTGDSDEGNVTTAGIQHRLAGAHLAQLSANKTSSWGDRPKIRLLLANPGSDFASWESVVDTIVQRRTADRIVAVTGISFSFEKALAAIDRLTNLEEPIPVFASTLTIDVFQGARAFLKVSPPASEHARAAAEFLAGDNEKILIVRDDNPADQYGRTLAGAFESQFPGDSPHFAGPPETYDAGFGQVSIAFRFMMANICDRKPSTIYFAGRGADALEFLTQLAQRDCREQPIQVMTADDMPYHQLADSVAGKALEGNVTVRYTGLAHPDAWDRNRNEFNPIAIDQFSPECEGPICYRAFSDGDVHDFAAVMEHDAVLAAVQATRWAAVAAGDDVDSNAVGQMMDQMRFNWAFAGASGKLNFIDGLPQGKPILLLEARNGRPPLYLESR
ncbi:amino acid ABC transporter substrate-binding protein [Nocardia speluncae]|uniref:Amino acid ABC transporter substrate-binding protein n=1 Tax=Nocardia speluncae TaxID=419477 RepID=A0A846XIS4_9NOCA|nr:ABC transporter substrate-binding protein [Nocardia speluncae]NKY35417.1 amino acid ABC transporter substrate-binding protein [Nocardia speluncae]